MLDLVKLRAERLASEGVAATPEAIAASLNEDLPDYADAETVRILLAWLRAEAA